MQVGMQNWPEWNIPYRKPLVKSCCYLGNNDHCLFLGFTPFSTVFQSYHSGQLTYAPFLGMLTLWCKRVTSTKQIHSPVTDNCPTWNSGRGRMAVERNNDQVSFKFNMRNKSWPCLHLQWSYHYPCVAKSPLFYSVNIVYMLLVTHSF